MTTETVSSRPVVRLHEKRKFNWLVLGLLALIAVTFLAGIYL